MAADSDLGAEALPNEVMTEILARLPAKSVGRFRCVSRGWSAMLSSDYFIDLHRQRANRPDHLRLLLTANGSSYDGYLYSRQPSGDGAVEKLMRDDFGLQYIVTKPCRGLWNPAVFLDGYLHFLCLDGGIVTFSIGDETFGSLLPPPDFGNVATAVLTELDGRLCEAQWEKLCCIDRTAWPESERMLLKSLWIAPVGVYYSADGALKIMFGTGSCKVFAVDSNGGGGPEILLTPEDTIIGSCEDDYLPTIGLYTTKNRGLYDKPELSWKVQKLS
ncbi:unnamed protein product [Miscanthus lutarioriparius]|uniref:F-box domain-containing protein n=1 Tax=Miscanthus lutarioriparius TaxID=422564 RepID=A0A811MUX4_9POAL|nr:unnamed protein product [Miscanthus lutarioriparius]